MPTYEFTCDNEHEIEIWCSVSAKPENGALKCAECGQPMVQFHTTAPHLWSGRFVLDYPGSKRLKAGYQHTHNLPATKTMSGPGGMSQRPADLPEWHNPIPGDPGKD